MWHFISTHAAKDAATDGHDATMSEPEFWLFINQFVSYFKLACSVTTEARAETK